MKKTKLFSILLGSAIVVFGLTKTRKPAKESSQADDILAVSSVAVGGILIGYGISV